MDEISVDDLRAVQAQISSGVWGENIQSADWAGRAVATVLGLDPKDDADVGRIKRYLKVWTRSGALKVESVHNPAKGRPRNVIKVGERV